MGKGRGEKGRGWGRGRIITATTLTVRDTTLVGSRDVKSGNRPLSGRTPNVAILFGLTLIQGQAPHRGNPKKNLPLFRRIDHYRHSVDRHSFLRQGG